MSELIDTTEMYLRTLYELEEEGRAPLRARIAERLHQSGPTVSQTVARMERDGLLTVQDDRRVELSPEGRRSAVRVMRKHRLAERLLTEVVGLEWELAHEEACRWEHVISEAVERRLFDLMGHPTLSPYGNPIPGLVELGAQPGGPRGPMPTLADVLRGGSPATARVVLLSEYAQANVGLLSLLGAAGVRPGAIIDASLEQGRLLLGPNGAGAADGCATDPAIAAHVVVEPVRAGGGEGAAAATLPASGNTPGGIAG